MELAFVISLALLFKTTNGFVPSGSIDLPTFLMKTIEKDSRIRQIMWLVESKTESFDLSKVATHIPSIIIPHKNANEKLGLKLSALPMFMTTRSTLIVISFNSMNFFPNNSLPDDMGILNFFTELIHANQRPKLLIIEKVQIGRNYRNLLKFMWERNFLDVTILELIHRSRNENLISTNPSMNLILQHYLNPFTARFTEREISLEGELFPEKVINLHGYKLKVGYFHYPPYVVVTRNKSGDVVNLDGPDYQLVRILSETMNFRVMEIVSTKNSWDRSVCEKEGNVGITRALLYNHINFVGVQSGRFMSECMLKVIKYIELSFQNIYYSPVTPTLSADNVSISVGMKVSYLMTMVILLVMAWLFAHVVKFAVANWRMIELFKMMLGMSSSSSPSESAERIFLTSTLFTYFLFSTEIFSAFTSINLHKQPIVVIDTMEELYASNLTPVIFPNVEPLFDASKLHIAKYINRSIIVVNTDKKCLEYLSTNGNVTCFMRSTIADLGIKEARKKKAAISMHRVNDYLTDLLSCLKCEPGFPYELRFRMLLTRFQQTGIPYKWYEKYFGTETEKPTMADAFNSDGDSSNLQIYQNMMVIFGFGFCSSLVAFIGEVCLHYYKLWRK
ncbi:uncharacterized protein LOC122500836 [Leptopilina heterotoma]|uniref:uncharacterized protein LOC122500836 n=1 Tax=Leptopilina heterotoma TaxID=63436 RepID=UPI001CA88D02|nr:uncharacterized protein LOC122500836 [Leptopilina heterotoma]